MTQRQDALAAIFLNISTLLTKLVKIVNLTSYLIFLNNYVSDALLRNLSSKKTPANLVLKIYFSIKLLKIVKPVIME